MRKRTAGASGSQAPMIDVVSVKPMEASHCGSLFPTAHPACMIFRRRQRAMGRWCAHSQSPRSSHASFVELGALTWPNGFDLDPVALHDRMSAPDELGREAAK